MRFFIRHRNRFRNIAIASFLSLNFFMIAACYTGEDGAWAATFLIAAIAIVCSLVCHLTQGLTWQDEAPRDLSTIYDNKVNNND